MDRRAFIGSMAACLLSLPRAVAAQQARSTPRLGYLAERPGASEFDEAFL
jgi:hypothetical protein